MLVAVPASMLVSSKPRMAATDLGQAGQATMQVFQRAIVTGSLLVLASGALSPAGAQPVGASPASEVLTNDSVLKLIAAGIPEQAIISKIRASNTNFDLSTDQLIALKDKGVSGPVLAAMLDPKPAAAPAQVEFSADSADPAVPHYPGIYLYDPGQKKMWRIMATSSNQAKTGGILGYALTFGLATMSIKAAIPGKSAKIQTNDKSPEFFFFFDESVPRSMQSMGNSIWTSGNGNMTSSPAELTLVRFNQKSTAREAQVGSVNIAGAKQGVMDKDQIAFQTQEVRPGVFKVTPNIVLTPGEYGFIQAMASGNAAGGGAMTARVFDFGVLANAPTQVTAAGGKETPFD